MGLDTASSDLPLRKNQSGDFRSCATKSPSWPSQSAKRIFTLDDPAIHIFAALEESKTWITGASPVMTTGCVGTTRRELPLPFIAREHAPYRARPPLQLALSRRGAH